MQVIPVSPIGLKMMLLRFLYLLKHGQVNKYSKAST